MKQVKKHICPSSMSFYLKRTIIIILSFLFVITETKAITPLKPFEFEISLSGTYGIDKYVGNRQIGPAFALEGRYNFYNNPIDIGMELYGGSTARSYEDTNLSNRIFKVSI